MAQRSLRKALAGLGFLCALLVILPKMSCANVILIGNSMSFSFDDTEASFVVAMKGSGICGVLQVAEPSDACSQLSNKNVSGEGANSPFVLIQRGKCSFETKVQIAQDAGFKAAIIYNNEDSSDLVTMRGNSKGITIYAVFVSEAAGHVLLKYAGDSNMECWIIPSLKNTSWSAMVISFASLVAMAAVLAMCIFVRKYRLQQVRHGLLHLDQLNGMSFLQVKALPSLIFNSVSGNNCTSETCAICLEDYTAGEKLRVLPCCHRFHALCIDSWLTMWRTFCPVCKRDARIINGEPPATESTPLLSATSLLSSPIPSAQSSFIGSPSMHASPSSVLPHAESACSLYSLNVSLCIPQTLDSCSVSSLLSRNSANIAHSCSVSSLLSRNSASIAHTSLLSLGIQSSLFSSQNSLSLSPHMASPVDSGPDCYNVSPQFDASFSLPPCIQSCGGSLGVMSPFNSTHSLPGYQECYV